MRHELSYKAAPGAKQSGRAQRAAVVGTAGGAQREAVARGHTKEGTAGGGGEGVGTVLVGGSGGNSGRQGPCRRVVRTAAATGNGGLRWSVRERLLRSRTTETEKLLHKFHQGRHPERAAVVRHSFVHIEKERRTGESLIQ